MAVSRGLIRMTRLLFLISEDWYFWSHRLSLARAAVAAGYEVALATRVSRYQKAIEEQKIRVYPLQWFERASATPGRELATMYELARIYRDFRPDVAHHVALKPVIYGTLAARLTGASRIVNALAGLGFVFQSSSASARVLRPLVQSAMRLTLNLHNGCVIVQNDADRRALIDRRLTSADRIEIIRGSGVDLAQFVATPEPQGAPIVVLPARMLWDKGVREFVEAARILRAAGAQARFVLVGQPDRQNPHSVTRSQLQAWVHEGAVEWWGLRLDMPAVLSHSCIVCLPSYHEGLPKVLLEAAACARPIVATDIPGCREIAHAGQNALLVPVGDAPALAHAIQALLSDPQMRRDFGARGRRIVEEQFTDQMVAEQTLALYARLLESTAAPATGQRV
ncbi:MAG TPA: glycosyltransferase family 4 protein [Burkholderiaceae bacterium]|nr:glycosyltransferase family 4 protein [Burkholderiaceae bacterium]